MKVLISFSESKKPATEYLCKNKFSAQKIAVERLYVNSNSKNVVHYKVEGEKYWYSIYITDKLFKRINKSLGNKEVLEIKCSGCGKVFYNTFVEIKVCNSCYNKLVEELEW